MLNLSSGLRYQAKREPDRLAIVYGDAAVTYGELVRLMNRKAAWEFDRGETGGVTAILAKLAGSDAGVMAAESAIQAHGGNGFVKEYDLVRLWAFLRLQKNAPIARQMTLNHIAEHALGLPKSY